MKEECFFFSIGVGENPTLSLFIMFIYEAIGYIKHFPINKKYLFTNFILKVIRKKNTENGKI